MHISWQDLYTQVRIKRSKVPLGLELSAWMLQFENREKNFVNIKKAENGQVVFFLNSMYQDLAVRNTNNVFTDTDLKSYDNFIKACILYFHINPVQLKNSYPRLFEEMNKMLCSELLLEAA